MIHRMSRGSCKLVDGESALLVLDVGITGTGYSVGQSIRRTGSECHRRRLWQHHIALIKYGPLPPLDIIHVIRISSRPFCIAEEIGRVSVATSDRVELLETTELEESVKCFGAIDGAWVVGRRGKGTGENVYLTSEGLSLVLRSFEHAFGFEDEFTLFAGG